MSTIETPNNDKSNKPKKEKFNKQTFIKVFLSILIVFFVLAGSAALGVYYLFRDTSHIEDKNKSFLDLQAEEIMKPKEPAVNVAVFGVDGDALHTDVIFIVHFDSENNEASLVSVPRDTRVTILPDLVASMKERGRYVPRNAVCKINEVHAYAGKDYQDEYSVLMLENLLGIDINYFIKIDFDGFKNIVDSIDGVEVDVPQRMNYSDPEQNLYINLQPGLQILDGDKAEQLVRFRRYPMGDVKRVEVQQLFLKAFAQKILNTETLINNAPSLISNFFQYVKTDMPLTEAVKYMKLAKDIDISSMEMATIPGEGTSTNPSYYIVYKDELREMINRIFYGIMPPETTTEQENDDAFTSETDS